jgi:hypothetical protein
MKPSPLCNQLLYGNETFVIRTRGKAVTNKITIKKTEGEEDDLNSILIAFRKRIGERYLFE